MDETRVSWRVGREWGRRRWTERERRRTMKACRRRTAEQITWRSVKSKARRDRGKSAKDGGGGDALVRHLANAYPALTLGFSGEVAQS